MKRAWFILIGGLVLALLAFGASYRAGSAKSCCMMESETPELNWLQEEFHLSPDDFARVKNLHESYLAACAERCRLIDAKNAELQALLAQTNGVTPEIEKKLQEAAQLRAECQKSMLAEFYEISRAMPPEQGKRYRDWIVGCTFGPAHESMTHVSPDADHESHRD